MVLPSRIVRTKILETNVLSRVACQVGPNRNGMERLWPLMSLSNIGHHDSIMTVIDRNFLRKKCIAAYYFLQDSKTNETHSRPHHRLSSLGPFPPHKTQMARRVLSEWHSQRAEAPELRCPARQPNSTRG